MQLTSAVVVSILAAVATAAPAARSVKSMADGSEWTIQSMTRSCNDDDSSCHWSFSINANDGSDATGCEYDVAAQNGSPASESPETGVNCGAFTITSGWSGQFGPDQGFTTLSVVQNDARLIAWPAYTDAQLANGAVVSPDQSYPVQNLP